MIHIMNYDIERKLIDTFDVSSIEIIDETHKHNKHPQSNGFHIKLEIVSKDFESMNLVERHRLIYNILDSMIKKEIHAISINAKTPKEVAKS